MDLPTLPTKRCVICDATLGGSLGSSRWVTCGEKCAHENDLRRMRQWNKQHKVYVTKICVICGNSFNPSTSDVACSARCRLERRRQWERQYIKTEPCKLRRREYRRVYRTTDKHIAYMADYNQRETTKTKMLMYAQRYKTKRNKRIRLLCKLNTSFKLRRHISSAVCNALKFKGVMKNGRMIESVIGYPVGVLRSHIERIFKPGMSWDNWGRGKGMWHIDHIRPLKSFTFSSIDDENIKKAWSLDNLQPLWEVENLKKGATWM